MLFSGTNGTGRKYLALPAAIHKKLKRYSHTTSRNVIHDIISERLY